MATNRPHVKELGNGKLETQLKQEGVLKHAQPSETALQQNTLCEAAKQNQSQSIHQWVPNDQVSAARHRPPTFNGFKALGVEQSMTKSTASFSWTISWQQFAGHSMMWQDIPVVPQKSAKGGGGSFNHMESRDEVSCCDG